MRLVVGMSGSSGSVYGIRLLEVLKRTEIIETHLVVSRWARAAIEYETKHTLEDVHRLAAKVYDVGDLDAAISRRSFRTDGMIVAPCSVKSLSAITNARNDNLLSRAAAMHLNEGRKLVLVLREASQSLMHVRLMRDATCSGAIVIPPEDVESTVQRALEHLHPTTCLPARS
ncbi:hypothetical protein DMH04_35135 [Kibdelosporangium aridum]|uniref:Flavoprotein domain-containing protein n=1 Tax=Kibdelosporangium aridum TaxID=2030 RepID=A0A428Z042_KIBAR|nr:UbiX family flavin prenyltransferase [Kibdelosporangium aridum]RSM77291.1 hypothetical protein DMH04_35135 [Kibdelosporangium aridum]